MAEKDYYSILGVEENASEDDIKKAYKQLCLKYHPDRLVNASEEEKKEAEAKFKDINEANSILSDPKERKEYDMRRKFGTTDDGWINPEDMFGGADPFEGFEFGRTRKRVERGSDIYASVDVTFEEAYNGAKKTIKIKRSSLCHHCNGTGSADGRKHACPHCNGTGWITKSIRTPFGMAQNSVQCPYCRGTGNEIHDKCNYCGGTGLEETDDEVTINVPAGIFDGAQLNISQMGNEPLHGDGINGDLHVMVRISPSDVFRREGNDLIYILKLNLQEAWCGCKKKVTNLNGKVINVTIPELTKCGARFVSRGEGFYDLRQGTRGNFVITVDYEIPKKLTNKMKDMLAEFCKE